MSTAPALIKCTLFFFLVASVCSKGVLKHAAPKQGSDCATQLNNIPQTCNRTLLGLGDDIPEPSSSEGRAALNAAFAQTCTPACIEPAVQYYQCISSSASQSNYLSNFVRNVYCGEEDGEYCTVRGIRLGNTLPSLDTCPNLNNNFTMVCTATTPQSCYDDLSTYSSRMGCCAAGIIPYRQNCRVTFDPPCSSPANGLYPFAALSMIAFAILGLLF
ncbi:PREDICTED: uncharacterized protein LOC109593712 isoform X2 [Amphimedon queenslandica]|uniref:Uncharacterized protein n=1 Tax=Amphimedon queenslandica TaxID=400682 RepID=A0A1X7VMQ9_AMPQE|nr:PREDICTED: uncharacterized protein LOC109593712 isoform X2 [Amphimedon queenslandica]|eukprot:XP_019864241.1 PREDICTED: uncharacterized protein LOC109593712 isoform X2 [Amphimedon queenslandica]